MPDYLQLARDLRAKAAYKPPPGSSLEAVGAEEAAALIAKAEELERKYGNPNSRLTNDTVTTSRDGHTMTYHEFISSLYRFHAEGNGRYSPYNAPPRNEAEYERRRQQSERIAEDLLKNQYRWNDKYYDEEGNPKPQTPDEATIVEEQYAYAPNEDEDEDYDPEGTWYNA